MDAKVLTIRIDKQDYLELKKLAEKEKRSLSFMCGMAIRELIKKKGK
jgi:predicted transcriptional regulator